MSQNITRLKKLIISENLYIETEINALNLIDEEIGSINELSSLSELVKTYKLQLQSKRLALIELNDKLDALNKEIELLKIQLTRILNSKSYKLGFLLLMPARKLLSLTRKSRSE